MNLFGIGTVELIFIIVVALLVLGPNRMVEMARTLGKYFREFQRTTAEVPRLLSISEDSTEPVLPSSSTGSIHSDPGMADTPDERIEKPLPGA
jgi:sec-independent protein translocase protein TatA